MKRALAIAYRLQKLLWKLFRPRTRGVKVMLFNPSGAAEGKRDTIYLYEAQSVGDAGPDGREVVEARFFSWEAFPPATSPATLRRIEEYLGKREVDGSW